MKTIKVQKKQVAFRWYVPSLLPEKLEDGWEDDVPYIQAVRLSKRQRAKIADGMFSIESMENRAVAMNPATTQLRYCLVSLRGWGGFVDENGEKIAFTGDEALSDIVLDSLSVEDYENFANIASGSVSLDALREMKNVVLQGEPLVN